MTRSADTDTPGAGSSPTEIESRSEIERWVLKPTGDSRSRFPAPLYSFSPCDAAIPIAEHFKAIYSSSPNRELYTPSTPGRSLKFTPISNTPQVSSKGVIEGALRTLLDANDEHPVMFNLVRRGDSYRVTSTDQFISSVPDGLKEAEAMLMFRIFLGKDHWDRDGYVLRFMPPTKVTSGDSLGVGVGSPASRDDAESRRQRSNKSKKLQPYPSSSLIDNIVASAHVSLETKPLTMQTPITTHDLFDLWTTLMPEVAESTDMTVDTHVDTEGYQRPMIKKFPLIVEDASGRQGCAGELHMGYAARLIPRREDQSSHNGTLSRLSRSTSRRLRRVRDALIDGDWLPAPQRFKNGDD